MIIIRLVSGGLLLLASFCVFAHDHDAVELVNRKAAILHAAHKKARKAIVNAAQDRAYVRLAQSKYAQDHRHDSADHRRADEISQKIINRFDIASMSLIMPDGTKLSRVVDHEIKHDLSTFDTTSPHFAKGFALRPRTTHMSSICLSEESKKWVIAYVTSVVAHGETIALLHYEHGLDVFQKMLSRKIQSPAIVIAVDQQDWVISDNRKVIDINLKDGSQNHNEYFEQFSFGGANLSAIKQMVNDSKTISSSEGIAYIGAYKQVGEWTLIVFVPKSS